MGNVQIPRSMIHDASRIRVGAIWVSNGHWGIRKANLTRAEQAVFEDHVSAAENCNGKNGSTEFVSMDRDQEQRVLEFSAEKKWTPTGRAVVPDRILVGTNGIGGVKVEYGDDSGGRVYFNLEYLRMASARKKGIDIHELFGESDKFTDANNQFTIAAMVLSDEEKDNLRR